MEKKSRDVNYLYKRFKSHHYSALAAQQNVERKHPDGILFGAELKENSCKNISQCRLLPAHEVSKYFQFSEPVAEYISVEKELL